jgi:hypothetical protein
MLVDYKNESALGRQHSKVRLLAVERMIDEGSKITIKEIQTRLFIEYGINASRPAIYSDLLAIEKFIPLESKTGPNGGYWKKEKDF